MHYLLFKHGGQRMVEEAQVEKAQEKVPAINHCKDLGPHFNVSAEAKYGAALTIRMEEATHNTERLDTHKAPYEKRDNHTGEDPPNRFIRMRTGTDKRGSDEIIQVSNCIVPNIRDSPKGHGSHIRRSNKRKLCGSGHARCM